VITLKQLEALRWIVQLGTFERAALRLNTTQSTISKRMQELESATGLDVFDRSQRQARLTEKGEALYALAQRMLALADDIETLKTADGAAPRTLRLGVTELTAWTWLPRLVTTLRKHYPGLILKPEVDMSRTLYERLREGRVDVIIIPDTLHRPEALAVPLAEVANSWVAKPGVVRTQPRTQTQTQNRKPTPLTLQQLAQYPVLVQGQRSGSGMHFSRWLKAQGVDIPQVIESDSFNAMLGMAVAGLGVIHMPTACFRSLVERGKLEEIQVAPALPAVPYAAMALAERPSRFIEGVLKLAQQTCDFSRQFQS